MKSEWNSLNLNETWIKMTYVDYPEPLMVIKPDLQANELFDERYVLCIL